MQRKSHHENYTKSLYMSGLWGGHTRWVERGGGGQYFERRQTLLCTLYMQVLCDKQYNIQEQVNSRLLLMVSDKALSQLQNLTFFLTELSPGFSAINLGDS
jgi:hypothetical protein